MVNSKKMSKSSIAVIVLAILLVLSMIIGITGAWFTSTGTGGTITDTSMNFGTVKYTLAVSGTSVSKAASGDGKSTSPYLLVADTEIATGVEITNNSTIDTYYVLYAKTAKKYYSIGENVLVEIATGGNAGSLTAATTTAKISVTYRVAEKANAGTSAATAFEKKGTGDTWTTVDLTGVAGFKLGTGESSATTLVYGDKVDLGLALVNADFELRAVQAQNVGTAAEAFVKLSTGWTTTSAK